MRILALMTEAFGAVGGIQQYGRDCLRALASCETVRGVDALVRRPRRAGVLPPGVNQYAPRGGKLGYSLAAVRLALVRRPDVVFCAHLNLASVARLVARLCGAAVWVQVYGIEVWHTPGRAARRLASEAALVTAISRDTLARTRAWADTPFWRLRIVAPTMATTFMPGPVPDEWLRSRGLVGRRIVLSVGRLASEEAYKGQDRVIAALPKLLDEYPNLLYLVVGDGDDLPRLRALAASCGVAEQVRFLGRVDDGELLSLYRAADLFVLASVGEGFGIVYLEAMACGCPALGLNRGGARDALEAHPLGHVCDETDLPASLQKYLRGPRPDPMPQAMQAFSFDRFRQRMQRLLLSLGEEGCR